MTIKDTLLAQYQKQWTWRDWDSLYSFLPDLNDKVIYDLGCAHGDHTQKLSSLGANVIGLDGNKELLNYAKERNLPNARFQLCNLDEIAELGLKEGDGVWMSFVAAYFTDFKTQLDKISKVLKESGWIAITEMSGLFDHLPLSNKYKSQIADFYDEMYSNGHYDFESGSKIKHYLMESGFKIMNSSFLIDNELSKQGPCSDDVIMAWRSRLARMRGFQKFLGDDFEGFEKEFLDCLKNEDHISNCKVYFYLAVKP